MTKVVLTGTTGMVGKLVLEQCLAHEKISKVVSIARRSTGIKHSKLSEVIHDNFLEYSPIIDHLQHVDLCIHCLGIYSRQAKDRNHFRTITVDYTRALAIALRSANPESVFCLFSAQGADSKEKSWIMFAKDKGAAENQVLALKFRRAHIFRPGFIYPTVPRPNPPWIERAMTRLYPTLTKVFPNLGISSAELAQIMIDVGLAGSDQVIFENRDMRRYLGLPS